MKNKLLIICFILLWTSITKSQIINKTQMGLNGDVKSLFKQEFDAKDMFGELKKVKSNSASNYVFNLKGYIIEETVYDIDTNRIGKRIYTYDVNDKLIDISFYKKNGDIYKDTYQYDENGNLKELVTGLKDKLFSEKEIYKYDANKNIIEKSKYDNGGYNYKKTLYKWDERGNLIEELNYNWEQKKNYSYTFIYDELNNVIESTYFLYSIPNYKENSSFKYDAQKNCIQKKRNDNEGTNDQHFLKYDQKNNNIETNYINQDESKNRRFTYKYDEKGNWTETICYFIDGRIDYKESVLIEYDEHGNWLKVTSFKNDFPQKITERKIEYY